MTRDSASGSGPDDSADNVTEAPEATEKTAKNVDGTVTTPASTNDDTTDTTTPLVTTGTAPTTPVAVDTTSDEPGDTSDPTDEGAVTSVEPVDSVEPADSETKDAGKPAPAVPADLTLKPIGTPKASPDAPAAEDTTVVPASTEPTAATPVPDGPDTAVTTPSPVPVPVAVPVGSHPAPATATGGPDGPAEVVETGTVPPHSSGPVPEKHSTLVPLVGTLIALAAIAALLIGAMALPIAKSSPHAVPVGVAGTEEITGQLTTLMQQFGGEGTFDIKVYDSQAELRDAIQDRESYGGLFVDNTQAQMMIATAAGIKVSDALQTVANALQSQAGATVTVTDVVPQPTEDPRGDGLAASELPLALIAVLPAIGLVLLYRRRPGAQVGAAVLASAAVGMAVAAVLNYGSGSTSGGNYWFLAGGLALGVFATTMLLLGLNALAGRIGLGLGAAVLVLLGAPLSGLSSVPEWLPDPWGTIGQILPTGATATVLRSMAFFDGHGSRSALLVFLLWTVVGLILLGLGTLLHRSNQRLAELKAEEESVRYDLDDDRTPATV